MNIAAQLPGAEGQRGHPRLDKATESPLKGAHGSDFGDQITPGVQQQDAEAQPPPPLQFRCCTANVARLHLVAKQQTLLLNSHTAGVQEDNNRHPPLRNKK